MTIPGINEDCALHLCNEAVTKLERLADYHSFERTHLAGAYYKDAAVFEKLAVAIKNNISVPTDLIADIISTKQGRELSLKVTPYLA